ncbi:MAG: hypothetical protein HY454_00365 [Parcubacteria group bacterium]|nr:hypothetical protein [Parcubacteria group bacterium]
MDAETDWYQLELLREILLEDPQTRKTHRQETFLIYDPMRNLWIDAAGQASGFRNDLFHPFTSKEGAVREVMRLNQERLNNRFPEAEGAREWPGDNGILKGI